MVLAAGLLLLAAAAWRDRQTRRQAEQVLGAPVRTLAPHPLASPDETQRAALAEFRRQATVVDARLADERLATWAEPATAEVAGAEVLVCAEAPGSLRELAASLERAGTRPLVAASPGWAPELLDLLAAAPGRRCTRLLAGDLAREQLASLTGATPVTRQDLQSGWAVRCHGRTGRLVADAETVWLDPQS